jgi:hypothetical protein
VTFSLQKTQTFFFGLRITAFGMWLHSRSVSNDQSGPEAKD